MRKLILLGLVTGLILPALGETPAAAKHESVSVEQLEQKLTANLSTRQKDTEADVTPSPVPPVQPAPAAPNQTASTPLNAQPAYVGVLPKPSGEPDRCSVLYARCMPHSLVFDHMFQLPVPILEKLLRPIIVYLVLVLLLRLFGKRELAQLNPFDLVVLLSLSNTVQNAIIGDDNSVSGGVVGAFSLLAINWIVVRMLFRSKHLTHALEGRATVLIHNGQIDRKAMEREALTREELLDVIHRQGFEYIHQVHKCELEPNGTFYVEAFEPSAADKRHEELLTRIEALSHEVAALRAGSGAN